MNSRVFFWSLIAALSGFLFGFDTVVISGAEQAIQELWDLHPAVHGLAMSMALWGTVLGAMVGSIPADRFGRKKTLTFIGALYFVSAIWSGLATDVYTLMIARFIGGIGVGVSTVASPLFIAEIAPAKMRGRLAGMFQFNIVFGILVAFLSNAFLGNIGENAWRWMLGVEAIPALIYCILCFSLPESPRWLIGVRKDIEAGCAVLRSIHPEAAQSDIERKAAEIEYAANKPSSSGGFWSSQLKTPILLAFLIAFFNQLSGINAILYFAPRIFELTGLEKSAALLQSIGIGLTNLVFTFVGLWLIDKLGRKTLLYIGSFGYIASLGLCSIAFFTESFAIVPVCIFAFIASHAVGQGSVIWVFISEIFPNRHRAQGQSFGSSIHWVFAALLTTLFPSMVTHFPASYIFLFFCFMMLLQLIWVKLIVPETKGISLEQIEESLGAKAANTIPAHREESVADDRIQYSDTKS